MLDLFGSVSSATRAAEVVAARESYWREKDRAIEGSDYPIAAACAEAIGAECRELWGRLATTPARTREGMLGKLAFAATHFEPDELSEDEASAEDLLISVAIDARRVLLGEEV